MFNEAKYLYIKNLKRVLSLLPEPLHERFQAILTVHLLPLIRSLHKSFNQHHSQFCTHPKKKLLLFIDPISQFFAANTKK